MNIVPWSGIALRICAAALIVLAVSRCGELAPPVNQGTLLEQSADKSPSVDASSILANPDTNLAVALNLYRSNQPDEAREIVDLIRSDAVSQSRLTPQGRFRLNLLSAHLELDTDREPHELVRALQPNSVTERIDALELWSRYLERIDNHDVAVSSLMTAKRLAEVVNPAHYQRINGQLWDLLIGMPYQQLADMHGRSNSNRHDGWIELAIGFSTSLSDATWRSKLSEWRLVHSQHADANWLRKRTIPPSERPRHIGVLLPQSGSDVLARAAQSIRDGWMLAYLHDSQHVDTRQLPTFTFYDTVGKNPEQLIRQAFAEGVDHVVGPLSKDAVNELQDARAFPGPVLMLNKPNSIRRPQPASTRYLAWSVEDEAVRMAQSLSRSEQVRCVVIYGNEPWMIRARAAFELNLAAPSRVIDVNRIGEFEQLTEEIGATIGIKESEERRQTIESIVQFQLEFEPRVNQEINSIVAFIDTRQLEAVLESLRFHADRPLSIYVTDAAVRGALPDLAEGVQFTTDTWRIFESDLADTVNAVFDTNPAMAGFYALGIDAYRFSNLWEYLKVSKTIAGHGSRYHLEPTGNLRRLPYWGEVRNNTLVPRVSGVATEMSNPYL